MKKFFALSRIQHGMLDIAMPAFCAILLLGGFPEYKILALSIFTAICGYISIYALNDLAGYKADKEKFINTSDYSGYAVETTADHHPLARELLSYRSGLLWTTGWFLGALIGAYFLHPMIIVIFLLGGILEFTYCRLLKVSYWRVILSGIVKACGPCAAIFVVDPNASWFPFLLILIWVFFWEVGGQNIPADWNDAKEDRLLGAKTIPVCLGSERAAMIVLGSLILTLLFSVLLCLIGSRKIDYINAWLL